MPWLVLLTIVLLGSYSPPLPWPGAPLLVLLMAVAGGASLGFPGLAMAAIVKAAHPVPEAYSCGLTQLLSQLIGAAVTQVRQA